MHDEDEKMRALVRDMHIPEPASNLEQRIIAAAKTKPQAKPAFGGKWFGFGPKLAVAASLAALAVVMLSQPETLPQPASVSERQMAVYEDPYSVGGIPLLADIEVFEEPEIELDMAVMEYQG